LVNYTADEFFELAGLLVAANNLSDLDNVATALTNLGISPFSLPTSATCLNNQGAAVDLGSFEFDSDDKSSTKLYVEINRSTDSGREVANGWLTLTFGSSGWILDEGPFHGDVDLDGAAGVEFSLRTVSATEVHLQYTSDNLAGANYSGTIRIKENYFETL
jgi:hypothetical protein